MPIAELTTALALKSLPPILHIAANAAKGPVAKALQKWQTAANLRKAVRTLARVENVKTLWSPDKEISLHAFYHPSKIRQSDGRFVSQAENGIRTKHINSIDDLPAGNLTIDGIVGQGKSIFLRFLASQCLRQQNPQIPIFIELRTLTQKVSLQQAIDNILRSIDVEPGQETFDYLAKENRIVLLLDAFDELQEELIVDTLSQIDLIATKHPELRIIVTSRPGNEIQKAPTFQTVKLQPLIPSEFSAFLQKLGLPQAKRSDILNAIRNNPSNIDNIIRTPLMLTLVVIVYESEREIPPTLSEFFERLFQVVFTRHDRLKAGFNRKHYSGLSERRLQTLFEAFCFMTMQAGHGRSLTTEQFHQNFDAAVSYTSDCLCDADAFRKDITRVACLMLEEGLDLTTFLHKSIVEYYAAAFIAHSNDEAAALFYKHSREDYRTWSAVITFLRDIDPYRFAKDYTIPDATELLATIDPIIKEKNLLELIKFLNVIQPGLGIAVRPDEKPVGDGPIPYSPRAYGPISDPQSLMQENFSDLLIEAGREAIPDFLSKGAVQDLISEYANMSSPTLTAAPDEVLISMITIIRNYGATSFYNALEQLSFRVRAARDAANAIIATQDRRKHIFEHLRK
jgi:hypothetical protein